MLPHSLMIWWPDHSSNAFTTPGIAQYIACANLLLKCYKGLIRVIAWKMVGNGTRSLLTKAGSLWMYHDSRYDFW